MSTWASALPPQTSRKTGVWFDLIPVPRRSDVIGERLSADGYEVISFDVIEPEHPRAAEHVPLDLADETATAAATTSR